MNKITVIGGGAAGLMAAIAAAKNGAQVSLIEPNERLGKKINITGKGRCNVTNDTDLEGLMAHIPVMADSFTAHCPTLPAGIPWRFSRAAACR